MFQRSLARAAHTRTYRAVDLFQQAEAVSQSSSERKQKQQKRYTKTSRCRHMKKKKKRKKRGWFGCCDSVPNHFTLDLFFPLSILHKTNTERIMWKNPLITKKFQHSPATTHRPIVCLRVEFSEKEHLHRGPVPFSFERRGEKIWPCVLYCCIPSEAMEQQTAGLRNTQSHPSSVRWLFLFFLSSTHTCRHSYGAWIWFRLERELREWTPVAPGDNDVRLVIITTKVFSLLSRDRYIHGRKKKKGRKVLFSYLRHLIGRVLKSSSGGILTWEKSRRRYQRFPRRIV